MALERRSGGLTIGCHNIRLMASGGDIDDEDNLEGSLGDSTNRALHSSALRGSIDTSFEVRDGVRPRRSSISGVNNVTPKKPGVNASVPHAHRSGTASSSSYANDHCKLRILEVQQHAINASFPGGSDHQQQRPEYEVSLAISMLDSTLAEHTRSMWWVRLLVKQFGMFLRHAGFRGRGCRTAYVEEVLHGVHEEQGSLLSLEMSDMWFFTVFLSTIATSTPQLLELQHLSLQACHVFPTMDETIGELLTQLPSLQSITIHQFDFTVGRAKQILEAASEHPCLRHINLNDNVIRTNAQTILNSNVQSIRQLESFHVNHLPDDFWSFGEFFSYKTNLRILQLSHCKLGEVAVRDIGHCLNVATMLEELILDHCCLQESSIELMFPCIRRGGGPMTHAVSSGFVNSSDPGESPLLLRQNESGGPSFNQPHHDTPEDPSRNTSPTPSTTASMQQLDLGVTSPPLPHHHQNHNPPHMTLGGGLGVNPYFAPSASPLQLMPLASPFSTEGEATLPYRSANFVHGPAFGAHTICATLPHLRVLNLSDNPIGLNGLSQLSTPLSRMQALEQLYLGGCGLHGENAAESVFAALDPICGGLFVLDLSRNDLGDKTVSELCNMNFFNKLSSNVAEVFLAETGLSQGSICTLLKVFGQHAEWLTLLDLSVNGWATPLAQQQGRAVFHVDPMIHIASPTTPAKLEHERISSLVTLLGAAMAHGVPVPVSQLRLSFCTFSADDWVEALRRIGRMETRHVPSPVEVLQLSSLFIGQRSAPAFGADHQSSEPASTTTSLSLLVHSISDVFGQTLTNLDLSRNRLGDDVVTELLVCHCGSGERKGQCVSCRLCRLHTLHLRKVEFGSLASSSLCEHGEGQPATSLVALTELDLSGNHITLPSLSQLSHFVLRHIPHLQRLDLSQNSILSPSGDLVSKYPLDRDEGQRTEQAPPHQPSVGKSSHRVEESSPHLVNLRLRRSHIARAFFEALVVAVGKCRGTLRRLKLDGNGLSQLHVTSDLKSTHDLPHSSELKTLLGPLGRVDFAILEEILGGVTWHNYLLFSIHFTSS